MRIPIVMISAFGIAGCLVADPPPYGAPGQTPPVLNLLRADPPISKILAATYDEVVKFNIPVRSEDRGDNLIAAVYLDWGFVEQAWQQNLELLPSTFEDQSRAIIFDWTVTRSVPPGCHHLTVLVSHKSTFDLVLQRSTDGQDQAMATWVVNVNPDESDLGTLRNCPTVAASP